MSWPPQFPGFDITDERMSLLFGYRGTRNGEKDLVGSRERDLERGKRLESDNSEGHAKSSHQADIGRCSQQTLLRVSDDATKPPKLVKLEVAHIRKSLLAPSIPRTHLTRDNSSFTSSTTTLMADKLGILDVPPKSQPLPEKRYGRIIRNLRWTFLSVYRRLNMLVLLPNIIVMIVLGVQHNLLRLSPDAVATAVAANITASVLIRQELLINLLFMIFGNAPQYLPLRVRRLSAKIYHLGGVHSGAGIAALVWFGLFNNAALNIPHSILYGHARNAVWALTFLLDLLLLSIVVLAHPHIRAKSHNLFEIVHRFAGWSAVGLFWALFLVLTSAQRFAFDPAPSLIQLLVEAPTFWLLIVITLSIMFPWLRLRRVPVHAEPLSNHAIRLHFTYTNAPLCSAPRMSDNPLKEWHAFAGIPEEDGQGFSVIVSKAGDWTTNIIRNPPTQIWVRGIPTRGVLHVAKIFRKLILVATGSGIGPILSLLYARQLNCRILWSTPDPETTYRKGILDHVRHGDPDAIIINTTISGRPNLVQQAYDLYTQSEAEAVFIISNPRVTRKFVYALESRGVPTFAPIFDS